MIESLRLTRRPSVGDAAVGVVFTALILLEFAERTDGWSVGSAMGALALTVIGLALVWRSVAPFEAYWANGIAIFWAIGLGIPSDFYPFTNLMLVFTVAMLEGVGRARAALAFSVVGVASYFARFSGLEGSIEALAVMLLTFVVWMAGRSIASRRNADELRRERDLSVELAETREARLRLDSQRQEMAREIHDLVGHSVNVMVMHAGAGRFALANDPDAAVRALETIENVGREALTELDRVLGLLRDDDDRERAPLRGVADLDSLVDRFRSAGLTVTLRSDVAEGELPIGVGATAYRVVQESLTNVAKHADATAVEVRLATSGSTLEVSVGDDGLGVDGPVGGTGLRGMSERVALHGGTLDHGNRPNGGYLVSARIPMETL